jgi:hypothetical protein
MRDVMHDIRVVPAIAPVVVVDNTATVSSVIDMQGAQSCALYVITGAPVDADATFAVLLQEGNAANLSDATNRCRHRYADRDSRGCALDRGELRLLGRHRGPARRL